MAKNTFLVTNFFKDDTGRIVIWQSPNVPLYGWAIFKILSLVVASEHLRSGSSQLSTAFLFVWSYLEVTKGVNVFRRLLGTVVLVVIVSGFVS